MRIRKVYMRFVANLFNSTKILLVFGLLILLSSCGGGQPTEDPAPVPAPTTPPNNPPPANPPPAPIPEEFSIQGSIQNLEHGQIQIQLNSEENIVLFAGDTSFRFDSTLQSGEPYSVRVLSHPTSPSITCSLNNASGNISSDVNNIEVICPELQSIQIDANYNSFAVGSSQVLVANAIYSDSSIHNISHLATWSSSDPSVITSNAAEVSAIAAGSAEISASFASQSGSRSLQAVSRNLSSIQISPVTVNIAAGEAIQLFAQGFYDDSSSQDISSQVNWSVDDPGLASISANGLLSATSNGSVQVSANLGAVTENKSISISNATLSSLEISPAFANLALGSQLQLSATGVYSDASSRDLTAFVNWSSTDDSIVSIDATGLLSAHATGSVLVQANYSGQTSSSSIQVQGISLSSIDLSSNPASLSQGFHSQFKAMGTYSDGSIIDISQQVIWSSNQLSMAEVSNAPGSKGRVSALGLGSLNITASLGAVSASHALTVSSASLDSIRIQPGSRLISQSEDLDFKATGVFSDASEIDITDQVLWSSSNLSLATISNSPGSEGNMLNLASGASTQSLSIQANYAAVSASVGLIITPATLQSLQILPDSLSINTFKTKDLKAYGFYSDDANVDMTDFVTWSSSDTSVAVVSNAQSNKGRLSSLTEGSPDITATYNSLSASNSFIVSDSAPETESDTGIGLFGTYHNTRFLDSPVGSRIDGTINFNWDRGLAPLGVGDNFSIRWTGKIKAIYSENYTITTRSDDGIRVYIDGNPVVMNWTNHSPRFDSGTIDLVAGQKHDIVIEFYENGGHAVIELYWQSASQAYEVVPSTQLFPE